MIFRAYEVLDDGRKLRRKDLPNFNTPDEVMLYLTNNPHVSVRRGKFVKLEWIEHKEGADHGDTTH